MSSIHVNYHRLPNKIYSLGLSVSEFVVLSYLLSLNGNFTIYPSKNTIAKNTNLSKRTVDRAINSLEKKCFLKHKKGFTYGKDRISNQYIVVLENIDPDCIKKSPKQLATETKNDMEFTEIVKKYYE